MKNTLILSVSLTLFASCGDNKTEPKAETKQEITATPESKVLSDTNSANNAEPNAAVKNEEIDHLLGSWEETKIQKTKDGDIIAIIGLKLMSNGEFLASAKSTLNGKVTNYPDRLGKWTLNGNTVNLEGVKKLVYNEKTKTLIDADKGVELHRK